MLSDPYHTGSGQFVYLDCVPYNRHAVLDDETKMWLMDRERQRLRTDASPDIDN
jgi:hypothetical protein